MTTPKTTPNAPREVNYPIHTTTDGQTPAGHRFQLIARYDHAGADATARTLQWLAFADVGPIGIPLNPMCPYGVVYYELVTFGELSPETRAASMLA